MQDVKENPEREDRIVMEIVVDAYDESERAMGWYCYLENTMKFPFAARCVHDRQISPLQPDDRVEVIGMSDSDECLSDMFVLIQWDDEELAVPLEQLKPVDCDDKTREAIEDWQYWVARGYEF